jgi:hypothetical protein
LAIFGLALNPFNERLDGIVRNLQQHRQAIEREVQHASRSQASQARANVEQRWKEEQIGELCVQEASYEYTNGLALQQDS